MNNARWQNTDQSIAAGSSPISVMRKQPFVSMQPPQLSPPAAWTAVALLTIFALTLLFILWRRAAARTRQ